MRNSNIKKKLNPRTYSVALITLKNSTFNQQLSVLQFTTEKNDLQGDDFK